MERYVVEMSMNIFYEERRLCGSYKLREIASERDQIDLHDTRGNRMIFITVRKGTTYADDL